MRVPLGSKIKALRLKQKICQQDLCCNILSRTILSKIENNKMFPSIPQLEHISKVLSIPLYCFFEDNELTADIVDEIETSSDQMIIIKDLFDNKKYLRLIDDYEQKNFKLGLDCIIYYYTGMSYFYINLYNSSLMLLRKFITNYKHSNDSYKYKNVEYFATALNTLSSIMFYNSNYKKALSYLNEAINVMELYKKCETKIYDIVISNVGSIYCKTQQYEKAIAVLESFLSNKYDMVYLLAGASIHLSLNIAYFQLSKYNDSINHVKKAIWLFNYIDRKFDSNECYLNYINMLRFTGNFDEAVSLIYSLKKENENDDELINLLLIEEMEVYFNLGEFDKLLVVLKSIKLKNLRKASKMDYYLIVGHVLFTEGNFNTSYNYLNKCIKYFISQKFYIDLKLIYDDFLIIFNDDNYRLLSEKYKKMDSKKNIIVY